MSDLKKMKPLTATAFGDCGWLLDNLSEIRRRQDEMIAQPDW